MKYKIRKLENGGRLSSPDNDIIDPDETMFDGDTGLPVARKDDFELNQGGEPNKKPEDNQGHEFEEEDPEDPADPNLKDDEPVNHADYVLRSLGFQTKQVDLGDGVLKNVSDLSHEEQLDVVTARLEEVVSFYEGKFGEIDASGGNFSNDIEKTLIKTLRDSEYNLSDLAKVIAENDPSTIARTASNEDLIKGHFKKIYPDFTDEEISEEIEGMAGTSRFDRLASKLRETVSTQKMGEGDLAKAVQKYQEAENQKVLIDFNTQKQEVVNFTTQLKEYAKIPLNDDVKNFVLQDILSDSPDKNSPFLDSLNTPEKLFRQSFLDKFHEQIVENTAKYYFDLGKAEGDKIAGQFRKTPDVISSGSKFKPKNTKGKDQKSEEEF